LRQLHTIFLSTHPNAKSQVISSSNFDPLKSQFVTDLQFVFSKEKPTHSIIINFWRDFKDHKGGHFSPISAYHANEQKVLILDVSKKRGEPHWLSIDVLILLMCKVDGTSREPRGYLLVGFH